MVQKAPVSCDTGAFCYCSHQLIKPLKEPEQRIAAHGQRTDTYALHRAACTGHAARIVRTVFLVQFVYCGVILACQNVRLAAVHADEVSGAAVCITVARERSAVRAAGIAYRNAHRGCRTVVHDVLCGGDQRIQMTEQIVNLVVIMAAPDDQLVEVDLARFRQCSYLIAEDAQA